MIAEGAAILDVGGESTRPGAEPVGVDEEVARVVPVLEGLADLPEVQDGSVRISIDTRHAEVARRAVAAGADIINDVSSTLDGVAAELGVGWVAMHMQGDPRTMQEQPSYDDVVSEVRDFLVQRAARAVQLGVTEVWIDPGIGFGKTTAHNLEIMGRLDELVDTGWPVVLGVSRKRFLGDLTARSDLGTAATPVEGHLDPTPPDDRREASVALATWAFHLGVSVVRAHDVRSTFQAARVVGSPGSRAR
jgi:dihydropteroate synthase